jgi:hypothetical protein
VCPGLSELAPKELWERFRIAAQALVAGNAERSFISILPPPEPSPEEMAARRERTQAAFANLVARMGDPGAGVLPHAAARRPACGR